MHAFRPLFAVLSRPTLGLLATALVCGSCQQKTPPGGTAGGSAATTAFRDAVNQPPKDWSGPVFQLSHDYPKALPAGDVKERAPWLKRNVDFSATSPKWTDGWSEYMSDVLTYIREGQNQDLTDAAGWKVEVGGATRWFHVPWMAYNPSSGREFIHGLTRERVATKEDLNGPEAHAPSMLATTTGKTDAKFATWAFGAYNEYGGHAIGKVIPPSGVPQTEKRGGQQVPAGLPFAEGTLVMKLLFTTATEKEAPFLKGSPEWQANRWTDEKTKARSPMPVHLVQMDIAVVDKRSPTGWVYGTFAYNGTIDAASAWDRLSPLGLQWGADPKTFPAVKKEDSVPASQTVLAPINIYEHNGPEKRLDGPVDNPLSSCMACHAAAYAAPIGSGAATPKIFGFPGMGTEFNAANQTYFANRKFPEPYDDGEFKDLIPLDTSLQLLVAFNSYQKFADTAKK